VLDNVKHEIEEVSDLSFDVFFQQYVMSIQDKLINDHVKQISHQIYNIEDIASFNNSISIICKDFMEDIYD